jgi:hypothetical protein
MAPEDKEDLKETPSEEETPDIIDLSDEDFLKMEEPPDAEDSDEPEPEEEKEDDNQAEQDPVEADASEDDEPASGDDGSEEEPEDDEDTGDSDPADTGDDSTDSDDSDDNAVDDKEEDTSDKDASKLDAEAELKKLFAPFKANGSEIQIQSVEDAITLMQKGANYHQKMVAIKPSLKMLKLLENHKLLDEGKLNYLIDLYTQKPEAITKLLKDSGMDPLDIDTKTDNTYTPTSRKVSDTEVALDQVLESIQDSPHYAQTLNVVSEKWDLESRNAVARNPQVIAFINSHMADGTYDKVAAKVAYERSLGRLAGVPDFEAYRSTGEKMYEAGELGPKTPPKAAPADTGNNGEQTTQKSKSKTETERKKRKQAAKTTRRAGSTPSSATFDPLSMSDEDFKKFEETKATKLGLR